MSKSVFDDNESPFYWHKKLSESPLSRDVFEGMSDQARLRLSVGLAASQQKMNHTFRPWRSPEASSSESSSGGSGEPLPSITQKEAGE